MQSPDSSVRTRRRSATETGRGWRLLRTAGAEADRR